MTRGEHVEAAAERACPFCGEKGFDSIGLKFHLRMGHCDAYEATQMPARAALSRTEQPDAAAVETGGFIDIVFDGPPGPESGRFIEVEDANGKSVDAGIWREREGGLWAFRVACAKPSGGLVDAVERVLLTAQPVTERQGDENVVIGYRHQTGAIHALLTAVRECGSSVSMPPPSPRGHDGGGGVRAWEIIDKDGAAVMDDHSFRTRAAAEAMAEQCRAWRWPQRAPFRVIPLYAHPTPAASEGERSRGCVVAFCNDHAEVEVVPGPFCPTCLAASLLRDGAKIGREGAMASKPPAASEGEGFDLTTAPKWINEAANAIMGEIIKQGDSWADLSDPEDYASLRGAVEGIIMRAVPREGERATAALDKVAKAAGYERAWLAPSGEPNIIVERKHPTDAGKIQIQRVDLLVAPRESEGERATIERCAKVCDERASFWRKQREEAIVRERAGSQRAHYEYRYSDLCDVRADEDDDRAKAIRALALREAGGTGEAFGGYERERAAFDAWWADKSDGYKRATAKGANLSGVAWDAYYQRALAAERGERGSG